MKYLLLLLSLVMVSCMHEVYPLEHTQGLTGTSAGGTNGAVAYHCDQINNNPSEVPVVCYFKNTTSKTDWATIRIGWYSDTTGEELVHTDWGGAELKAGGEKKYYFHYPLADLRLHCGYNFDRCVMLIDRP